MNDSTLRRMRFLMNRLPAARFRKERALSKATRVTTQLTGMPGGGGSGDTLAMNTELYMIAKEAYEAIQSQLSMLRYKLKPCIDRLDDPLERTVMTMRYMDGLRAVEIAYRLNYSERWIYKTLDRAEKRVQSVQ